jgi:DNA repair exonuclease SbcCD ATPase subunit
MAVVYAVNVDRVRSAYVSLQAKEAATNAIYSNTASAAATAQTKSAAQLAEVQNALNDAVAANRSLQQEQANLLTAKNKAEAALSSIESKIAELGETVRTQAALITSYRDENSSLRNNELTYRQRALEMDERLSDLESQREVLDQRYKATLEQIADLQKQLSSGGTATASAGGASQPFVYSGPRIQGSIEEVQQDAATGRQLVRLNVGTNDRVAKSMKFLVVRDNQFLCNVVVTQPDLRWSIGVIDTLNKNVDVRPGDQVLSRAN